MQLLEALHTTAKSNQIQTFGSSLETPAQNNKFRIHLPTFKPHQIIAAAQAIPLAADYITEISISNGSDPLVLTAPSHHSFYLENVGIFENSVQKVTGSSIFDRLTPKGPQRDVAPKDIKISQNVVQKDDEKLLKKAIYTLLKIIAETLPGMQKLQVFSVYSLKPTIVFEKLLQNLIICSNRNGKVNCLICNDLVNEKVSKRVIQASYELKNLQVLALQNSGLKDLTGGQLINNLIKIHANNREKLLWERNLRKNDDNNNKTELNLINMRNSLLGLKYLDLSYNSFKNEFLEQVQESLITDQYIQTIDLQGNNFTEDSRFLPKTTQFDNFFQQNFTENTTNQSGKYISISISLNRFIFTQYQNIQTLTKLQKLVLEEFAPDYFSPTNATVSQLLTNYAQNVQELDFLSNGQPHPLILILLHNNTLQSVQYDEKIDFPLREFINLKLKINEKSLQEIKNLAFDLAENQQFQREKSERKVSQKNVQGMMLKMSKAEDFASYKRGCESRSGSRSGSAQKVKKQFISTKIESKKDQESYESQFKIHMKVPVAYKRSQSSGKGVKRGKSSAKKLSKSTVQVQEKPLEIQSKQKLLKQKIKHSQHSIYAQMDKMGKNITQQRDQISALQDNLTASQSIANNLENQLFTPQKQLLTTPNISSIEENSIATNSSEKLFNRVLDGAYGGLMARFDGNKQMALRCFEEHQDVILVECERILEAVRLGKYDEDDVEDVVKRRVNEVI